jgi:hypothetical protein
MIVDIKNEQSTNDDQDILSFENEQQPLFSLKTNYPNLSDSTNTSSYTAYDSNIKKAFNSFIDRIAFDVENKEGLIKPTIDVANKLFQIGEVNDDVLTKSMAELGWALLDKYTQREIVKHYGKAKLLGGDITDNIIYDLQ